MFIDDKYHDELLVYNPWTIGAMDQTERRQEIAIKIDPSVYAVIKNPTRNIQLLTLEELKRNHDEVCTCLKRHEILEGLKHEKRIIPYTKSEFNSTSF